LKSQESENSQNVAKKIPRPKFGSKNSFYKSQPYLFGPNSKQKVGIYQAAGIKPTIATLDTEKFEFGFKATRKRPITRSKKRKKTKSSKRKKFSFMNNYINEQYKELQKKESQNTFIKMQLYKEIGIPPLPIGERKQSMTVDRRVSSTTTSTKIQTKKENIKTVDPEEPKLEFNKQLGLFRRIRPKTPVAAVR